jgi:uncharacterized membrane protein SpoIIM required for sporulation
VSAPLPHFVAARKPEWDRLAQRLTALEKKQLSLDALAELDLLYRRTASDLATAQTHYRGTEAHRFLNQLCARAYSAIYAPPRDRREAVLAFFRREFPRALRREKRFVLASLGLFLIGILLGALVVAFDPHGAELFVPQGIRDAVEAHQMWTDSILSVTPPGAVASRIATNNLSVTIAAFVGGAFFGLGTVYLLVMNGILLGGPAMLCIQHGMGGALLSFVVSHGPVELSVIVISGGAGLMVGHALIDPGELPRAVFLKRRATEAVKLVLGCAPFLACIGMVEGFVSPGHLFGDPLKIALGLSLGALFWGYLLRAGRGEASEPTP